MAVRTILHYPDPRLREPGKKVHGLTDELRQLIDDMAETMYAAPGVGLAATQIGEPWQIFVVDCAAEGEPSDLRVFVNPEIQATEGNRIARDRPAALGHAQHDLVDPLDGDPVAA